MANPTSNFGWQMPTNTDLVKDLPADFEVFGQAVDTSLMDLKGGTTGQVLSKASNTDMDFTWVAQDDSNAIQNALLTTTGDTIYASGASTPARLGIGSTGQVLTVSGGVPVWSTISAGGITLLSTTTLSGTKTTVSSISQDYRNLYVIIDGATWDTGGAILDCSPNDSSSGIYYGGTENNTVFTRSNQPFYLSGNYNILNTGGNNYYVITFRDYTSTTKWKGIELYGSHNGSPSGTYSLNYAGAWRSTSAITSLAFEAEGFNITGGTMRIFGEK